MDGVVAANQQLNQCMSAVQREGKLLGIDHVLPYTLLRGLRISDYFTTDIDPSSLPALLRLSSALPVFPPVTGVETERAVRVGVATVLPVAGTKAWLSR